MRLCKSKEVVRRRRRKGIIRYPLDRSKIVENWIVKMKKAMGGIEMKSMGKVSEVSIPKALTLGIIDRQGGSKPEIHTTPSIESSRVRK